VSGPTKVAKYWRTASMSVGGSSGATLNFCIRTVYACSVTFAARGLAARRVLRRIDSTVAGVRGLRSLGPTLISGDSIGMHTRSSVCCIIAAVDVLGGVNTTAVILGPSCVAATSSSSSSPPPNVGTSSSLKMAPGKMPADTGNACLRPRAKFHACARARHPPRTPSYARTRYLRACLVPAGTPVCPPDLEGAWAATARTTTGWRERRQ
jgi:hypothetical protein